MVLLPRTARAVESQAFICVACGSSRSASRAAQANSRDAVVWVAFGGKHFRCRGLVARKCKAVVDWPLHGR
eukprot:3967923-Lingulodinium_polyedra.AAC.1